MKTCRGRLLLRVTRSNTISLFKNDCPVSVLNNYAFNFLSPPFFPLFLHSPHPSSPTLHPGGSDGRHHHGSGSGFTWTTLLPAGRLWEVPSSGGRQGLLWLCSTCRGHLVGTKGKNQRTEPLINIFLFYPPPFIVSVFNKYESFRRL